MIDLNTVHLAFESYLRETYPKITFPQMVRHWVRFEESLFHTKKGQNVTDSLRYGSWETEPKKGTNKSSTKTKKRKTVK